MLHEWLLVHHKTETDYWWFINKRRWAHALLSRYAPGSGLVLEAGCGGGFFSSELQAGGRNIISGDLSPVAAQFAHEQGVRKTLSFDAGRGWPFRDASVASVVMLDMLEHVERDGECLAEVSRVLRPSGIVVLTVPAYPWLFSAWDEYNEHFRRYTAKSLSAAARAAGFQIERCSYWNAASVPPAIALRWKDRLLGAKLKDLEFPAVPRWVNAALVAYGRVELAWLRHLPLPFGLSVWAVLKKR
ncbi:MAG TPA: class I SAM-dependent methyltransferase [Candidatus Hydrogenedentes bacterium]|nr:class I SAM-dependent methyltransferase [Candidatus Hydrogenedentota bacterium]